MLRSITVLHLVLWTKILNKYGQISADLLVAGLIEVPIKTRRGAQDLVVPSHGFEKILYRNMHRLSTFSIGGRSRLLSSNGTGWKYINQNLEYDGSPGSRWNNLTIERKVIFADTFSKKGGTGHIGNERWSRGHCSPHNRPRLREVGRKGCDLCRAAFHGWSGEMQLGCIQVLHSSSKPQRSAWSNVINIGERHWREESDWEDCGSYHEKERSAVSKNAAKLLLSVTSVLVPIVTYVVDMTKKAVACALKKAVCAVPLSPQPSKSKLCLSRLKEH